MEETSQQRYERKRKTIKTRFHLDKEYPKLILAAEKAGYSRKELSKYLKYISLEGKVIIKTAPIIELDTAKVLLFQTRRILGDLNKLTRIANQNKKSELNQDVLDTIINLAKILINIENLFETKPNE